MGETEELGSKLKTSQDMLEKCELELLSFQDKAKGTEAEIKEKTEQQVRLEQNISQLQARLVEMQVGG